MIAIPAPSSDHEAAPRGGSNAFLLRRLIQTYTEIRAIPIATFGRMRFKGEGVVDGFDAGECFYIRNEFHVHSYERPEFPEGHPPDLVIEVDLTRSDLARQKFYAELGVPELWRFEDGKLIVRQLSSGGRFVEVGVSSNLPDLPLDEVQRFMDARHRMAETQWIRGFRKWLEEFSQI